MAVFRGTLVATIFSVDKFREDLIASTIVFVKSAISGIISVTVIVSCDGMAGDGINGVDGIALVRPKDEFPCNTNCAASYTFSTGNGIFGW